MAKEDGFHALLGIGKERLLSRDFCRGGLEAELEHAMVTIERATAKAVAVRSLISKLPEVLEAERKYEAMAEGHNIYPVDPTRNYKPTDPEGCAEAIGFCDFRSQEDFESVMGIAMSLRETYNGAYKKCCGWECDIRTEAVVHISRCLPYERDRRERLMRAEKIGSEATFVIPELARFIDRDIKVYLQSAKVRGFDTAKYDSAIKTVCRVL